MGRWLWAQSSGISTGDITTHLALLRVGSDGSSSEIDVQDWRSTSDSSSIETWSMPACDGLLSDTTSVQYVVTGSIPTLTVSGPMTNADTGAVLSWQADSGYYCASATGNGGPVLCNTGVPPVSTFGLATTSGGNVVSKSVERLPGQASPIAPVLQGQDGTFYGTVGIGPSPGTVTQTNMIAFDSSGRLKWSVPNDSPQIATADGGVIGASGVTYDSNGNVTGQLASFLTQSWTGNQYQLGSVESVLSAAGRLAQSFWAIAGGNASANGTAIRPITQDVRDKVAQVARSKVGSQNWLDQPGHNQCNIFVHDVLKEAGTTPPESDATSWKHRAAYYLGLVDSLNYPAQAGDWANPNMTLRCWKTLTVNIAAVGPPPLPGTLPPDVSIPGDVIAEAVQYSDATGHVGVIVGTQQTASADSTTNCDHSGLPPGVITITDYGFRPDNYQRTCVLPDGSTGVLTHGQKRYAVVKRFVCQ